VSAPAGTTPPGPVLGVVGGGQLGRMLALAAHPLGVRCVVVEPSPSPPAAAAAEVLAAPYGDAAALAELGRRAAAVTVELEEVDTDALAAMEQSTGVPVRPSVASIRTCQDRLLEKELARSLGLATAPFRDVTSRDDLAALGFPAVLKLRRGGFDGRGQVVLHGADDVEAAWAWAAARPALVEGWVPFRREVSVLVARSATGEVRSWSPVENVHVDGQLAESRAPADVPGAEELGRRLVEGLDHVGVLAVELFDTAEGLVVNELAPRVHNSGHWTIEGAQTSQFEQHVRAVLGWPLGSTAPTGHSAMVNLLGTVPPVEAVLAVPGAHLHLYGKAERPGRKLGHVTLVAPTPAELEARRASLAEALRRAG